MRAKKPKASFYNAAEKSIILTNLKLKAILVVILYKKHKKLWDQLKVSLVQTIIIRQTRTFTITEIWGLLYVSWRIASNLHNNKYIVFVVLLQMY